MMGIKGWEPPQNSCLPHCTGYNKNISNLMTFIFRNRTIFWDIPKWNREQTKWDGESNKVKNFINNV